MFVLDGHGRPLQPCTPARARQLLKKGRAVVHRHTPFVIRLKDRSIDSSEVDGVEVGVDPGSRHTGIAVFTAQAGERRARFAIRLRSRGGSDRVSSLTLACVSCNQAKGNRPIEDFLTRKPELLAKIIAQAKAPLRDAAAVQSSRWALWRALDIRLPTHVASGGRTKWNRTRNHLPKTHTLDALAVGKLDSISETVSTVLVAGCAGRGTHTRTRPDKYGFPRLHMPRRKLYFGFQTGDFVRAIVPTGKKQGTHTGRVAARTNGYFNVTTVHRTVQGVHHRHFRLLQRADGYAYTTQKEGRASSSG
ncbi:RRXRR domain-containing protein [Nonomuraea sp. NPDC051941]|uniref:RRXRR domain-containing protein n=1 Tax=Nonomuraea sp. NPDC051941 TaxID=3364373 RepID=UPI0037CA5A65